MKEIIFSIILISTTIIYSQNDDLKKSFFVLDVDISAEINNYMNLKDHKGFGYGIGCSNIFMFNKTNTKSSFGLYATYLSIYLSINRYEYYDSYHNTSGDRVKVVTLIGSKLGPVYRLKINEDFSIFTYAQGYIAYANYMSMYRPIEGDNSGVGYNTYAFKTPIGMKINYNELQIGFELDYGVLHEYYYSSTNEKTIYSLSTVNIVFGLML